ncbi:MAG TPA: permease prefix domain 1-containing protein, partial [Vicinamibacteria bacterium]
MGLRAWLERLRRRRLDEEDFQEEIRAHLAMDARERMADGADPRSAELASLKEFGNVLLTTEAARRVWTPWWVDAFRDVASDARYGVRALVKKPAFSLAVVGVLTLGIGLNAAVFTMLKGIALSPIAGVARSAELATIYGETSAGRDVDVSYPDYQYLRDHDRAFAGLFGSTVAKVGLG